MFQNGNNNNNNVDGWEQTAPDMSDKANQTRHSLKFENLLKILMSQFTLVLLTSRKGDLVNTMHKKSGC